MESFAYILILTLGISTL
ncbi:MAG: photosystem II reaction center protein T, partial [Vulcanococcus sp.]